MAHNMECRQKQTLEVCQQLIIFLAQLYEV